MTEKEFEWLPWLLAEGDVTRATGNARNTIHKLVESGVLRRVKLKGMLPCRYQKRQIAQLAGIEWQRLAPAGSRAWAELPLLLDEKTVRVWTGFDGKTLAKIAKAGGVKAVRPGGSNAKYRKREIGEWLGIETV